LQGEADKSEPGVARADGCGVGGKNLVGESPERVGDQQFSADAAREAQEAAEQVAPFDRRRRGDLVLHLVIFENGSREQFWEEQHEQAVVDK
jgi:hypothetical protein